MGQKKVPKAVFVEKKKLGILRYDLKNRRIYLVGEIIRGMSRIVERAINLMQKKDPRAPITLCLSSDGGSYPESLEIYQIIRNSRTRVDIIVSDKAFSGASLILQAGKKRIAFHGAKIGFHKALGWPVLSEGPFNYDAYMDMAKEHLEIDTLQRFIYTRRGRPVEKILGFFNLGAQFTVAEAKELKLIDEIMK